MKKKTISLLLVLALVVAVGNAFAESSATASANATVSPVLSIAKLKDLNFGKFSVGAKGGYILLGLVGVGDEVDADGWGRKKDGVGNTITLEATTPAAHAASFTITGEVGATFFYNYDIGNTRTLTSGTNTMSYTLYDPLMLDGSDFLDSSGTIPEGGTLDIYIGGVLIVGDNQPAGDYSDTFSITVSYI